MRELSQGKKEAKVTADTNVEYGEACRLLTAAYLVYKKATKVSAENRVTFINDLAVAKAKVGKQQQPMH